MAIIEQDAAASLERLKTSAPFRRLTESQGTFLLAYLTDDDQQAAVRKGYPGAKESSLASMAWQVLQSEGIKDTLSWFRFRNAEASREALIDVVRKQLAAAVPGSVSAQRLCAQLQSLTIGLADVAPVRDTEPPEIRPSKDPIPAAAKQEAFHIGQRVDSKPDAMGRIHVGVITAFKPDGTPVIEEVTV